MSQAKPSCPRVLRLPRVLEITGLSRASVYRLEKAGAFPKHVSLTQRASGWLESEVLAWLDERLARRDSAPKEAACG